MYIFKTDAAELIGLAGIAQAEVARWAKLGRHHLNKKINGRTPVRMPTAARIARAFAELTRTRQAEAMTRLFDEYAPQDSSEEHGSAVVLR